MQRLLVGKTTNTRIVDGWSIFTSRLTDQIDKLGRRCLNQYVLLEQIGQGKNSLVFRCIDRTNGASDCYRNDAAISSRKGFLLFRERSGSPCFRESGGGFPF